MRSALRLGRASAMEADDKLIAAPWLEGSAWNPAGPLPPPSHRGQSCSRLLILCSLDFWGGHQDFRWRTASASASWPGIWGARSRARTSWPPRGRSRSAPTASSTLRQFGRRSPPIPIRPARRARSRPFTGQRTENERLSLPRPSSSRLPSRRSSPPRGSARSSWPRGSRRMARHLQLCQNGREDRPDLAARSGACRGTRQVDRRRGSGPALGRRDREAHHDRDGGPANNGITAPWLLDGVMNGQAFRTCVVESKRTRT